MLYIYIYLAIGMLFIGAGMLIMGDDFDKEMDEALGIYKDIPAIKEAVILLIILLWAPAALSRIFEAIFGEQK